jgi:hypothetical protein
VREALSELSYPLGAIAAEVFLLPFPRRAGLESAAGPGVVLLSPGVRPLPREQQHAEFVHEMGHVVQYAKMPDSDEPTWSAYRQMRGIDDPSRFNAGAPHDQRPHEIFAEDFRALFGGGAANYSGTIENATIAPPQQVPGLREFVLALQGTALQVRLGGAPNPSRGAVLFSRAGTSDSPVDVFDVGGRRIATLPPMAVPGGTLWRWDGHGRNGTHGGPSVVFARERSGRGATARVTLLP